MPTLISGSHPWKLAIKVDNRMPTLHSANFDILMPTFHSSPQLQLAEAHQLGVVLSGGRVRRKLGDWGSTMNHGGRVLNFYRSTYWGWDKMAAFCQTTFSNAFSWMKVYGLRLRFYWNLFPMVQLRRNKYMQSNLFMKRSDYKYLFL